MRRTAPPPCPYTVHDPNDPLRYVVRAKERGVWQKERDRLLAEQKELEGEIAEFVALHESEINELLQEYWTMRKQAGELIHSFAVCRPHSTPLTPCPTPLS